MGNDASTDIDAGVAMDVDAGVDVGVDAGTAGDVGACVAIVDAGVDVGADLDAAVNTDLAEPIAAWISISWDSCFNGMLYLLALPPVTNIDWTLKPYASENHKALFAFDDNSHILLRLCVMEILPRQPVGTRPSNLSSSLILTYILLLFSFSLLISACVFSVIFSTLILVELSKLVYWLAKFCLDFLNDN